MAERHIIVEDIHYLDIAEGIDARPDKLISVDLLVPNGKKDPVLRFSYEIEKRVVSVNKTKFLWVKAETTISNDKAEFYKSFVYQDEIYYLYLVK